MGSAIRAKRNPVTLFILRQFLNVDSGIVSSVMVADSIRPSRSIRCFNDSISRVRRLAKAKSFI